MPNGEEEMSFELPDDQISKIARQLIADGKKPEESGLYGDVRKRVQDAFDRIMRETAPKSTLGRLDS